MFSCKCDKPPSVDRRILFQLTKALSLDVEGKGGEKEEGIVGRTTMDGWIIPQKTVDKSRKRTTRSSLQRNINIPDTIIERMKPMQNYAFAIDWQTETTTTTNWDERSERRGNLPRPYKAMFARVTHILWRRKNFFLSLFITYNSSRNWFFSIQTFSRGFLLQLQWMKTRQKCNARLHV